LVIALVLALPTGIVPAQTVFQGNLLGYHNVVPFIQNSSQTVPDAWN
jgi:hypothetical protein